MKEPFFTQKNLGARIGWEHHAFQRGADHADYYWLSTPEGENPWWLSRWFVIMLNSIQQTRIPKDSIVFPQLSNEDAETTCRWRDEDSHYHCCKENTPTYTYQ